MKKNFEKFESFIHHELSSSLKDILVIRSNDRYELFGIYKIAINSKGHWEVADKNTGNSYEFSSMKVAVTWCTFDHASKFMESKLIKQLDSQLSSVNVDILIHKKNIDNINLDEDLRWTQRIKLQEDLRKKRQVLRELNRLINTSKSIQVQKFNAKKKQTVFNRKR